MQILVQILKASSGSLDHWADLDGTVWRAMEAAGIKQWRIGDPAPAIGRRLLVGVASYSQTDLELAQELIVQQSEGPGLVIDFFNVMNVKEMAGFDEYVPGIGSVYQTPVVGFWKDGRLEGAAQGSAARELAHGVLARNL